MIAKKLTDSGILRAYPRSSLESLALRVKDTRGSTPSWSYARGGDIDVGLSTVAERRAHPPAWATPPTSAPTRQHSDHTVESTTQFDGCSTTDTPLPHAPVVPVFVLRRKKAGKRPILESDVEGSRRLLINADKYLKASHSVTIGRVAKEKTNSHHGAELASSLQGNLDVPESEKSATSPSFSEVPKNSEIASRSTFPGAVSTFSGAEDVVMAAVDTQTSVLKEVRDASGSQHCEQKKGRASWKPMSSYESEQVKSELMESSAESDTRGTMPDDPAGERQRDNTSKVSEKRRTLVYHTRLKIDKDSLSMTS